MPSAAIVHHALGHIRGFATHRSRGGIKRLRHQLVATSEHKKTAGVNGIGLRAEQRTIFPAIERCVIKHVVPCLGSIMVERDIEEMLTVGKKKRPAMRGVQGGVKLRNWNWSPPVGAHSHERRCGSRGEQDHSIRSPGTAATERYITNYLCRAAFEVDRFELAIGKESEGTAVGRPEGKSRAVGAGQFASFHRVRGADPECRLAVRAGGRKRDG